MDANHCSTETALVCLVAESKRSSVARNGEPPRAEGTDVILTILVTVLVIVFVATIVWFATHRDGNSMDNVPEGGQANPPVNGTGLWN